MYLYILYRCICVLSNCFKEKLPAIITSSKNAIFSVNTSTLKPPYYSPAAIHTANCTINTAYPITVLILC